MPKAERCKICGKTTPRAHSWTWCDRCINQFEHVANAGIGRACDWAADRARKAERERAKQRKVLR